MDVDRGEFSQRCSCMRVFSKVFRVAGQWRATVVGTVLISWKLLVQEDRFGFPRATNRAWDAWQPGKPVRVSSAAAFLWSAILQEEFVLDTMEQCHLTKASRRWNCQWHSMSLVSSTKGCYSDSLLPCKCRRLGHVIRSASACSRSIQGQCFGSGVSRVWPPTPHGAVGSCSLWSCSHSISIPCWWNWCENLGEMSNFSKISSKNKFINLERRDRKWLKVTKQCKTIDSAPPKTIASQFRTGQL